MHALITHIGHALAVDDWAASFIVGWLLVLALSAWVAYVSVRSSLAERGAERR
jgi:hypothetical protein